MTCQENNEWRNYCVCFLLQKHFSMFSMENSDPALCREQRHAWLFVPFLCKFPESEGQTKKRKSDNFSVLEQETEGREGRVKLWMPLECYRSLIQTRGSTQHLTGSRSPQRWDATAKTHQPGLASPLEVCEEKEIKYLYKCRWKGTSGSLQSTLSHRAGQSPISDQITCGFV